MATLRTYSSTFEQSSLAGAAVARWRFNEGSGSTATDSVAGLDGTYEAGAAAGAAGVIGDGAASFDGSGIVLVQTLSGTIRVATLGDSLADPDAGHQPAGQTFADELPNALQARGLTVEYLDHAVAGERTDEGLARVGAVIGDNPDVVILELGTNDAIQQRPIAEVEASLRSIITQLHDGGVDQILLTGTFGFYPESGVGAGYASPADRDSFEQVFRNLAADPDLNVVLLNDVDGSDNFLGGERIAGDPDVISGGVLGDSTLNDDGLHPNALGIDQIVPRIVPQTIALGAAAGVINEPLLLANGSFELWFTADSVAGDHMLVAKNSLGQGTGGQFAILIRDGVAFFALGDDQTNFVAASGDPVVAAGAPTHLVANFGADGMHLFIDGVEVASNPYTGGLDAGLGNFEPLVIGAESGFSTPGTTDNLLAFFNGTIDEFAIYDQALTAGQINQLFVAGGQGTTLIGTAADDVLIGGSDAEVFRGARGDDVISARGGDDRLLGNAGADDLRGGAGDDRLWGGGGRDALAGGVGDDLLRGEGGRDSLSGGDDADRLFGGGAIDRLSGGRGDDLLNGGVGADRLTGGAGSDTFQISRVGHGVDQILDFESGAGGDVLDLHNVLDFQDGDDLSSFVRLNEVEGNTGVEVNANGAGSDFTAVFNLIGTAELDLNTLVSDGNVQLTATPTS